MPASAAAGAPAPGKRRRGRSVSPTASRSSVFARDGMFLPSSRDKRLRFATLNLARVVLEVKKVYASNLGQFLQTERLHSGKQRRDNFRDYNVRPRRRAGRPRHPRDLRPRNAWLEHELDLGALIAEGETGPLPGRPELRPGRHAVPVCGRRGRGDPPALPAASPQRHLLLRSAIRGLRPRPWTRLEGSGRQRHRPDLQARPRPAPRVRQPHRQCPAPARSRGHPAHLPEPGRGQRHHRRPRDGAFR